TGPPIPFSWSERRERPMKKIVDDRVLRRREIRIARKFETIACARFVLRRPAECRRIDLQRTLRKRIEPRRAALMQKLRRRARRRCEPEGAANDGVKGNAVKHDHRAYSFRVRVVSGSVGRRGC